MKKCSPPYGGVSFAFGQKSRNNGTMEWRNDGTAEKKRNPIKGGIAERRKISRSPKRRNDGISTEIVEDKSKKETVN